MEARRFYLDTQNRTFVAGADSTLAAIQPLFFEEDVESVELYFLQPTGSFSEPYEYLNYSSNTVKLAVGITNAAALQTSWTALSTTCTATVTTLTAGGSGSNEVQKITFSTVPAIGGFAITLPARAVTVSSVSAGVFTAANHGLLDGQSVTLSAFSISGSSFANAAYFVTQRTTDTFRIASTVGGSPIVAAVTSGGGTATLSAITTGQIPANATAQTVQDAFVGAGIAVGSSPQIIVAGSFSSGFTLTFANTQANINFDPVTISSTLAAAPGLAANVSFNTTEIAALLAAGTTNVTLEVEVSDGTVRQTYKTPASISTDIISSASPTPTPGTATFFLTSPDESVWAVSIANDGSLTATKQ